MLTTLGQTYNEKEQKDVGENVWFGNDERSVSKFKVSDKGSVKKAARLEVNSGTGKPPHILY